MAQVHGVEMTIASNRFKSKTFLYGIFENLKTLQNRLECAPKINITAMRL